MVAGMYWRDFVVVAAVTNHAIDDCSLVCSATSMVMDCCVAAAFVQPFDRLVYVPEFAYAHDHRLDSDGQLQLHLDFDDQMNAVFAATVIKNVT